MASTHETTPRASLLITSRDEVLAEVRPLPPTKRPARKPGALRGKIRMAADFDQTPDDLIDAMEGKFGEGKV